MARAYSDDLRMKLLEAHAQGKGTLPELAERFGVSVSWAWNVSAHYGRTGRMERTPQRRRGPVPMAIDEPVQKLVQRQPDMVLWELQEALARGGHTVSRTHLWRVLQRLKLPLKKSRSMPLSATPNSTAPVAMTSSKRSARPRPKT